MFKRMSDNASGTSDQVGIQYRPRQRMATSQRHEHTGATNIVA